MYVISENQRTLEAADAMARGDAAHLGRLLNLSHASLHDDFEVSRPELDQMVALAQAQPGCYGARMTGAGFGGCAVAIVEAKFASEFSAQVSAAYQQATGLVPRLYLCTAAQGAELFRLS
jgi:galactokinase